MYPRSEILFPHRCVSSLRQLRGPKWQVLIDRVSVLPERHVDALAFSLMMIKLNKCLNCDLGSYKASLGCCACARRAINSFKGTDNQLVKKFEAARRELLEYLQSQDTDIETTMAEPPAFETESVHF
ncbi:MAG: hypothetical protein ACOYZ7_10970 [Chloroflexota bacterium]